MWGLGFGDWDLWFVVWGLGFRADGFGFMVQCLGVRVQGLVCRTQDPGFGFTSRPTRGKRAACLPPMTWEAAYTPELSLSI